MKRKILVIDDEPPMVQLVTLILEKVGYEVVGAGGGEDGLEKLEKEKPDLVLLDLMMPGMSGWDVYQHMQRLKANDEMKDTPVIVVTARTEPIDEVLARHIAKVQDYVTKPFAPEHLVESIRRVLGDEGIPA